MKLIAYLCAIQEQQTTKTIKIMAQKQVIALIRTSTTKQEVESQKQELIEYILNDGVNAENIIVVGHEGASAIKVDEAYQKNMQAVYNLIDGGNIAAVYAWGVDRIGRNEEILLGFKTKLVSNGVQLVIKNPSLRLLNDDGSVNNGVELAFSLFCTLAKQEMETKKARFKRAKTRNTEQGRYNGGRIHFGYTVNDNGKVVVNDEEAELVKLIYELYASGEYSTTTLTKELQSRGYTVRGKAVSLHFITNMLKSTAFIGFTEYNGVKRTYDRIISNELFETVKQRLTANHKGDITRQSKHTHLASKLIVCPTCGRHWFASNRSYMCIGHKYHGKDLQGVDTCPNGDSIAVEWVDVAALCVAKTLEVEYMLNFTETKAEEAKNQLEINAQKIETLQARINKMDERKQRIAEMYINGDISRDEQARQSAKVKTDMAEYNAQIVKLNEENAKLNDLVVYAEDYKFMQLDEWMSKGGIYDDVERGYKIVHKHIKQITVEPFEYMGKTQKMITVTTLLGQAVEFLYIAKSKVKENGMPIKLFLRETEDEFTPLLMGSKLVMPM